MSDLSSADVNAFAVTVMQMHSDGTATSSGYVVPLQWWDSFVMILAQYGAHIGDTLLPAETMPETLEAVAKGSIEL